MKTRLLNLGLILAVAALGFWMARMDASISAANNEIADLNKKLTVALHDASVARIQSQKPVVEIVSVPTAPATAAQAAKINASADPQAALAAAQDMPAGADRDSAMDAALAAYAALDPQAAWDLAQTLPDDTGGNRLNTLKDILKAWSAKDPAQAAAKLAALAVEESKDSATNTTGVIASNWLKVDPDAAIKWIDSLPTGNGRDSAIQALVPVAMANDIPTAFNWVNSMTDFSTRGTILNKVVAQWAKTDPAAATAAVMARPNKNNGRQEALLAIIQQNAPNSPANPAANGNPPAP